MQGRLRIDKVVSVTLLDSKRKHNLSNFEEKDS